MDTDFVRDTRYPVPPGTLVHFEFEAAVRTPRIGNVFPLHEGHEAVVSVWALSRTRRAIDFFVAGFALVAFLPLISVIAIAVRLSSPGPAFFKQKRMGRSSNVFTLYKFRSMRVAADHSSPITVTGDRRITRIGKILRKYKLDELPQFWNVLRGDMSLVGPRPKLPHHEGLHMPFRPGITGAATLAFRFEEQMLSQVPIQHLDTYYEKFVKPCKAKIDCEYMRSASLRTDIEILWQTARCCVSNHETQHRVKLPEFADTLLDGDFPHPEADRRVTLSVGVV